LHYFGTYILYVEVLLVINNTVCNTYVLPFIVIVWLFEGIVHVLLHLKDHEIDHDR
jgi:hypothetical protein